MIVMITIILEITTIIIFTIRRVEVIKISAIIIISIINNVKNKFNNSFNYSLALQYYGSE